MKAYQVQFILPCEQPAKNIVKKRRKDVLIFEVPINTPNCQSIGLDDLLEMTKDQKLLPLHTPLNTDKDVIKKEKS